LYALHFPVCLPVIGLHFVYNIKQATVANALKPKVFLLARTKPIDTIYLLLLSRANLKSSRANKQE